MFRWFTNYSVDGILGEFHLMIQKLENAFDHHNVEMNNHYDAVAKHQELALTAANEAQRAQTIAAKLKELVG